MDMIEIIEKKKQGQVLTEEEITFFVEGYTNDNIPDYQMSALLMAIYFKGMDREETSLLTKAMQYSGDIIDLSLIKGIKVDKHSTGGVGDKTSLIVGPLAAACGVPIAKMSGRGLGFTGGTVDKMESIPGFQTTLKENEFIDLVNRVGLSIIGQTSHVAPADKKIYALRDVTATVDQASLIASSIMSKKLASGSDAIVLDVKCGNGAFMKTMEEAVNLGEILVAIGKSAGKRTIVAITDMNQPLGMEIGNSNEVIEAIETLKCKGPDDITELSLSLAGMMIFAGEKAFSPEEGKLMAKEALVNGNALEKMTDFIEGQGGNPQVIEDYNLFPTPTHFKEVKGPTMDGFITEISAEQIGLASQHSGAGRATKDEEIDLSAGISLKKKVGDPYKDGEVLAIVFGQNIDKVERGAQEAEKAFTIGKSRIEPNELIKRILS